MTTSTCTVQQLPLPVLLQKYKRSKAIFKQFLTKYLQYIQSSARQEAILKTLQYTLWLLSRVHTKFSSSSTANKSKMVEALAVLSGELSWARYILRWFGLPAAIEGVESGSWASNSKALGKAMAWTMVGYYPLEHLAYLYWKVPSVQWINPKIATRWNPFGPGYSLNSNRRTNDPPTTCPSSTTTWTSSQIASKAAAWSCRFWLAYLLLDIARSIMVLNKEEKVRKSRLFNDDKKAVASESCSSNGNGLKPSDDVANVESNTLPIANVRLIQHERLQLLRSSLYLLPTINWSLPNWDTKPWLSSDVVNGLCWLEAVVCMYQGIRNFQES